MIEQVLREINHYFVISADLVSAFAQLQNIYVDDTSKFVVGQYVYVQGSVLNDGVYRIESIDSNLGILKTVEPITMAETVHCSVYGLAIPRMVVDLANEIKTYVDVQTGGSNVTQESLGDYSVTYNKDNTWQNVFRNRLNQYRYVYLDLPSKSRTVTFND